MDLNFTEEDTAFREEVRDWLAANRPTEPCPPVGNAMRSYLLAWQRKLYEAGWAGIDWPKEYGGRGLSPVRQIIWHEEYARLDAPPVGCLFVGVNHAGPTLIAKGSEEQKSFHLPRILKGEVVWCQGFSEPNAGSDLAAISTRATIEGDCLIVNGQKIWTSYAHLADYQELLVRTDPELPKHQGLTWLICDMKSPGITIRALETAAGNRHFCEVFYDNVSIPLSNVVGGVNNGWRTAMSTLSFERGTGFTAHQIELERRIESLIELASRIPAPEGHGVALDDSAVRNEIAELRADVMSLKAMTYLGVSRSMRRDMPGPESTFLSLHFAEVAQRLYRLAMELLGPVGLDRGSPSEGWADQYLESLRLTIAGGTSEIRRNIIGDRVLGLPKGY